MIKLKIPVNKTEELVIVSHKGILNIEKYKGDQRIEVRLKDNVAIIETLIYFQTVEWKIDKECRNKPIKVELPVNKTEDLVFILQHEGMLSIKKVGDSQGIEIREKDIPRLVDALIFVDTQEHKFLT
jgi:hypothetical protein